MHLTDSLYNYILSYDVIIFIKIYSTLLNVIMEHLHRCISDCKINK